jgi:hypothetical protein
MCDNKPEPGSDIEDWESPIDDDDNDRPIASTNRVDRTVMNTTASKHMHSGRILNESHISIIL